MKHQHFIVNCSHCITHQCSLLASFSAQTRIGHPSSLSLQHSLQLDNQYFLISPPQSLQGAPHSVLACHASSLQLQPLHIVYHHQQPSSFALHSTSVFQPVMGTYMNTVPSICHMRPTSIHNDAHTTEYHCLWNVYVLVQWRELYNIRTYVHM